ncbi:hypothetical protein ACSNO4_13150 [Kocuria flava]|uniref:hypothetical protein n=1 Tax=Kocuria flava TaxID=446860 RepID=UPI003F1CA1E9
MSGRPAEDGAPPARATVRVTVVVDDAHRTAMESVCTHLRAEGMHVEQVLAVLGLVTGELPAARLPAVRGVEGVAGVEEQREHRLPPPDAPVQ